ncbi:SU10 major capsid protein [Poriferisphaera sp. WC338]|uniref:SU10 major capsid protein n=1 Tax=Poriferisphaera sp. WC338 TaxID=3425129 RepID=UPI003D81998E
MAFTGKATYDAGTSLPEIAEDISDVVSIVSPYETPLLNHLGDAPYSAKSTVHEWLEDTLQPNTSLLAVALSAVETEIESQHAGTFRVGDLVRIEGSSEVMLVTSANSAEETAIAIRGYGGTTATTHTSGTKVYIIGNATLEGGEAGDVRYTNRTRKQNYTQILSAKVNVSGSVLATKTIGIADELDYQKQERLRELMRDLENSVINGVAPASNQQGNSTTRRSMNGLTSLIQTNVSAAGGAALTEDLLNSTLRGIWEESSSHIDTILVNGFQKRQINQFITSSRGFDASDRKFSDLVSVYESDFGVCRVIMSRWVPQDSVLLLDSSRISVLPLTGRSFHYKTLASTGDSENGMVVGEYTAEVRNEQAHGIIDGLSTS